MTCIDDPDNNGSDPGSWAEALLFVPKQNPGPFTAGTGGVVPVCCAHGVPAQFPGASFSGNDQPAGNDGAAIPPLGRAVTQIPSRNSHTADNARGCEGMAPAGTKAERGSGHRKQSECHASANQLNGEGR